MSTRIEYLCDYAFADEGEHAASRTVELTLGDMRYRIDLCVPDMQALGERLMEIGFRPTTARVGKDTRGAYITHSGVPFTASEARLWLTANGYELPPSGRLSREMTERYAATH